MHDKPFMNLEDVEAKIKEEEISGKTTKIITKLPIVDDNGILESNGSCGSGGCDSCGTEE